ncbi:MAG: hypothetical protein AAGJ31_14385, partial [Verrucomicrobiota bacterium]
MDYPKFPWPQITSQQWFTAITLCLLLTVAGDRLGGLLLRGLTAQSQLRFSRLYAGKAEADILILGDSRGVNSFYAPSLGQKLKKRVFNLSYNGLSPMDAELLFADYLDSHSAPDLLLLEITNLRSSSFSLVPELSMYLGQSRRLRATLSQEALPPTSLSWLYRYNNELFLRSLFYLPQSDQTWINRYHMDPIVAASYHPEQYGRGDYPKASERGLQALQSLIAKASENGVTVRLVVGPYLPAFIHQVRGFQQWRKSV